MVWFWHTAQPQTKCNGFFSLSSSLESGPPWRSSPLASFILFESTQQMTIYNNKSENTSCSVWSATRETHVPRALCARAQKHRIQMVCTNDKQKIKINKRISSARRMVPKSRDTHILYDLVRFSLCCRGRMAMVFSMRHTVIYHIIVVRADFYVLPFRECNAQIVRERILCNELKYIET